MRSRRNGKSRITRAVIYVTGNADERDKQLQWCHELCERRGYKISFVARDDGDGSGFVDAQVLRRSGLADKIVVYSGDVLPQFDFESATGEIPRVPLAERRPARYTRIRPVRRSGGAGA